MPRAEFESRLGNIARYTALPLSPNLPVAALASDFLSMLASRADTIDQSMGDKIAQQALDLVAIAFETVGGGVAAAIFHPRDDADTAEVGHRNATSRSGAEARDRRGGCGN